MSVEFRGFPAEGIKFMRQLARNNRREWFQPRKDTYDQSVRAPMLDLVAALNLELARFAPDYITEPSKALFRIYRDTRFSNDKTPYKTHVSAVFGRRGMEKHGGGMFYIGISAKEIEVAGGIHRPDKDQTLAIRNHFLDHADEFRRLVAAAKLRKLMGELRGAELSRVPKGFDSSHSAVDLIKKKEWLHWVLLDAAIATTPDLLPEIATRFKAMLPIVEFLNRPIVAARRAKNGPPEYY